MEAQAGLMLEQPEQKVVPPPSLPNMYILYIQYRVYCPGFEDSEHPYLVFSASSESVLFPLAPLG